MTNPGVLPKREQGEARRKSGVQDDDTDDGAPDDAGGGAGEAPARGHEAVVDVAPQRERWSEPYRVHGNEMAGVEEALHLVREQGLGSCQRKTLLAVGVNARSSRVVQDENQSPSPTKVARDQRLPGPQTFRGTLVLTAHAPRECLPLESSTDQR